MNLLRILSEMTNDRKKTEELITNLSYQPLLHIIKILRYDDPRNYNHHISDINTWLTDIIKYIYRYKGKQLKLEQLLDWMLNDHTALDFVKMFSRDESIGSLKKYSNLSKLRSFEEIEIIINDIYPELIEDLLDNSFEGIQKYFK
jgi:hypothetical protein